MKLANKFLDFELITQEGILISSRIVKIKVNTSMGGLTILPNHAKLKSDLVKGCMEVFFFDESQEVEKYQIADGVIEATPNRVTVITHKAELQEDYDPYKL